MITIHDQLGNIISLQQPARRIISLVPSQTELLFDLSLQDSIVGVTRFCVHPPQAIEDKTVVGGTKKVVMQRIIDLAPDLIICNKEENTSEIVNQCQLITTTYVSDVKNLGDAISMIRDIGILTDSGNIAAVLSASIQTRFDLLQFSSTHSALYLIWKDPYMSVGNDTFIHNMMAHAGFKNVCNNHTRYPTLTVARIVDLAPQVVLFSSEPYNFTDVDMLDIESAFAKANKPPPRCIRVDGEMFSWYGSRLLQASAYFKELRESVVI